MTNHHHCTFTGFQDTWLTPNAAGIFLRRAGQTNFPSKARLYADGGCAAKVPPIALRQIARNRRHSQANRALCSIRMHIEHLIGFHEVYASISSIFRHKRCFVPFVVCTCGFIYIKQEKGNPQAETHLKPLWIIQILRLRFIEVNSHVRDRSTINIYCCNVSFGYFEAIKSPHYILLDWEINTVTGNKIPLILCELTNESLIPSETKPGISLP